MMFLRVYVMAGLLANRMGAIAMPCVEVGGFLNIGGILNGD